MKRNGFTLIEVIIATSISCIVMLTVAILVQSGYKSWNKTYNTSNANSRLDSIATITAFGSFGRKSNKNDYYVYSISGTDFTRVTPVTNPEEIRTGQAVEFRYWSTDLTAAMLTPTSVADCYALFYLDGSQLKLDISDPTNGGIGPPAINTSRHRVTGTGVTTIVLANNVTSVAFSHTTKNMAGDGYGCVRMKLIINDPNDQKTNTFLAATYIRNVWPQ